MPPTPHDHSNAPCRRLPGTPWGSVAPGVTCVAHPGTSRTGELAGHCPGRRWGRRVRVTEVELLAAGLERLRSEAFDAVLVDRQVEGAEPSWLVQAIRAGYILSSRARLGRGTRQRSRQLAV